MDHLFKKNKQKQGEKINSYVKKEKSAFGGSRDDEESVSFSPSFDAVYDCSDNLARECREFYEKRLNGGDQRTVEVVSACSSGYFSLENSMSASGSKTHTTTINNNNNIDDFVSEDAAKFQNKLDFLRSELRSLTKYDNDLFKQLLTLNDTIEGLKEARSKGCVSLQVADDDDNDDDDDLVEESVDDDVEEEDEEDESQEINDLLDEALDLTDDSNDSSSESPKLSVNPKSSSSNRVPGAAAAGGNPLIAARSSFLQRPRVTFPPTGKNRRKYRLDDDEVLVRRTDGGKINDGYHTLPGRLRHHKQNKCEQQQQQQQQPQHVKQSSFDSGITTSSTQYSDTCSETNSCDP